MQFVEEGGLEREAHDDLFAGNGQLDVGHTVGVGRCEMVNTVGVGVAHGAHVGAQVGVVFGLDEIAHAEELHDVVELGHVHATHRANLRARHQHAVFHVGGVVLAMGESQGIGGVGVGLAEHMGYAELVAQDAGVVFACWGDEGGTVLPGTACATGDHKRDKEKRIGIAAA